MHLFSFGKLFCDLLPSVASQLASALMKRRLYVTNFSSENNDVSTECSSRHQALMTTGTFSRNVSKLFSELKLVPDNLLFKIITIVTC